ncbi:MAG TPA: carboxypeptidase regulatory-like domain-containing protein [Pyrinomonadaceae bacterium]|nr:carboxypeptidase regulatory-like domain-containing protein [Pyrinomonadaceae bacterium]
MTRRHARAAALGLLLLLCGGPARAAAQSPTATLSGTVLDEAGAVIPGVSLTALNAATAVQRHAATDGEGRFAIPLLPPGRYHLTAQHAGFATLEVRNVVLNVNDQLALRIRLKVGEIGESVTVVEGLGGVGGGGLQQSPGVSTVVNRRFVENLPLNGRSFHSLVGLAPGSVLTRASFDEQGQFSVNGQRPNANYFTVDGVSANFGASAGAAPGQAAGGGLPALTALGGTNNLVSVDALEEFRVHTSAYAPEFGRTPGAQVSIITRSGTNEFHGSVFNYFRDDALDANDWFANSRRLPKPSISQNDFGGVLGGPLVRERAHFFASYEGLRLSQPQVAVTEVPSLAARAAAPAPLRPLLDAFPLPNGRETRAGLAEFAASYSDPSRLDAASVRLDTTLGERLTLFGRYAYAPSEVAQRGSVIRPGFTAHRLVNPTLALSLNTLGRTALSTQTLTAGATFAAAPNLVSETRINWSGATGETAFALDDFGGAAPPTPSLVFPAGRSAEDAAFQLLVAGGLNTNLYTGQNVSNRQRQLNLVSHLSAGAGGHQLKFGVDYRRLTPVYGPVTYNQSVAYGGVTGDAGQAPRGTLLSGTAEAVEVSAGAGPRFPVFQNLSAYAQDAWAVGRRLSVTYGLRWELNPPPSEATGNHPLVLREVENVQQVSPAPYGTPLWRTTFLDFAPRLGLAYQLSARQGRELTLRAGAGLFYDLGTGQAAQGFGSVTPFVAARRFEDVPFPLRPDEAAPPPLPDPRSPLTPGTPFTIVAFDPRLQLPRSFQWNVTLDHAVGPDRRVSVAYVAALGRRLLREDAVVGLDPPGSLLLVTTNAARSSYHALQAQATRRLSAGLQAVAAYTWSHSIDDSSSDALSRLRPPGVFPGGAGRRGGDRGPSDFDVRHSFTLGATYNFPPFLGAAGAAGGLLRDWALDAIFRARTATPVNVVTRTDVIGRGLVVELQRPDLLEGVPVYVEDPTVGGGRRLNRAAFRAPAGRQGSLGQNALRGFGVSQLDVALRRQISLGERWRLHLRAEAFNLLNHPNFGDPVGDLSSPRFGEATETLARSLGAGGVNGGLSPIYQLGGARSVQLAVKLLF